MTYKTILLILQKYLLVKNSFRSSKYNRLHIMSILRHSKIRVSGIDNSVELCDGNFKRVKIGIDGNNNKITIKKDTYIRNLEIIMQGSNHTLCIGQRTEIGGATIVCCGENSRILIGDDCLLASNIDIKSCDGHSIYKNNEVINNSKDIIINNNVWIAQHVNILKGVTIGNNSVIGINSLLTSNIFESNVVIAGVPAKVIKRNITWGKERTL
ncbi:acyltransferase [Candidatus Sulfurimonas baltica]|uniref:Acyltransferase n=1 Tax=Candidatus Sulfurimonas baltica TaxID=2740404 RepID=A0A7S7LTU5_9BACT|nr:acyltransferase [Candidatus Sulfurimonas baltica]QOY51422.1 acyltransferase [Candidatus Sulfurimonas baltica]